MVEFVDLTTQTDLGEAALSSSGTATITALLPAGSDAVAANYLGSANFAASSQRRPSAQV